MQLSQFLLSVAVEVSSANSEGEEYRTFQIKQIDLLGGDVKAFLDEIPNGDISRSQIWVCIRTADGKSMSYADGTRIERNPESGTYSAPQMDDFGRELARRQVEIMAERQFIRAHDANDG